MNRQDLSLFFTSMREGYLQFGDSSLSFSGMNMVLAGGFIDIAWNGPLAHAAQQTDWQKIRSVAKNFNGMHHNSGWWA